jgi:thiosulfate reductase/polysulfide reductase chain A
MSEKTVRTLCFECHSRCGVLVEVRDGKIVGIKGDKEHPFSRGFTCFKARAVKEMIYHPDRITQPLVSLGGRGRGRWEEVSWDKALDIIAERLLRMREKWGAESVVMGQGTTRGLPPIQKRFLACFGSPNMMGTQNMSGGPIFVGSNVTCGFAALMNPDFAQSKCIVLWAHNPEASLAGLESNDVRQALKGGAKLIVVDPRRIPLAEKADHWLPVRPGTDVALALCFLNVIIRNELYDKEFVEKWTEGFSELREHVAPFTPERCAEITWIPSEEIERAAFSVAESKSACIGVGLAGVCHTTNAFALNRALCILAAVTGNLEVPGGLVNFRIPTGDRWCYGEDFDLMKNLPEEQANKMLVLQHYPLLSLLPSPAEVVWPAILDADPYPIKAMGLFANNAMCAFANSRKVKEALSALEFLFSVDYFHTPTTEIADIVLPPAHWSERDDIEELLMRNYVFAQPKAVDPVPECRDEKQIFIELANRMGLEGFWKTVEEALSYRLEPIGMTYAEFKEVGSACTPIEYKTYEKNGFATPTGKVVLSADFLAPYGIEALPTYREPARSPVSTPELHKDYPLVLTTGGRNIVYYHSAHRNIPSLRKHAPDPELHIHPETARELGIEDGEWVFLATPLGRVEIRARHFDGLHPRVVHAPHGYWYGEKDGWERLNINMITYNEPLCPVTAGPPLKELLCRVEKHRSDAILNG